MARRTRNDPARNVDGARKGRGLSKKPKQWGKTKLNVLFNEYGQPCGGDNDKLATQLGVFVKDGSKFPLNKVWKQMEPAVLENIWTDVEDNTNAPPEYKKFCFASLNHQWREWKHSVKGIYKCLKTDEERLAIVPQSVLEVQWVDLVSKWGLPKSKEESIINKENRSKQDFLPRTGKKSHSKIRKERQDEGKPIDQMSMFIATRTNKVGETLDITTSNMIDTLNDAVEELPEEERNSPSKRRKIFTDHLGKDGHGRLRCMGLGLTKSMVFGKASTIDIDEKMESQRLAMEAEFSKQLAAQKEAQQADFSRQLEAQKEAQEADFSKRLDAQKKAQKEEQEAFQRKLLQQLQAANIGITFQPI